MTASAADVSRTPVALVLLVAFCAVAFLPGLSSIPPLDRDEPRFAQASKQMLESGDYVDIRFQDEARHKKPVGIYWLQAAAVAMIGGARDRIWKYRTVSVLGAVLAVLATFLMARTFLPRGPAFATALLLASTILLGVEAHIAKTDAMLLACVVGAQAVLARAWLDARTCSAAMAMVFWALIGAGFLLKGPIILMVVGLTAFALCLWHREMRWLLRLRPLPGIAVLAAMVAPWFVAIALRSEGAFFDEALGRDLFAKIATGQESHGAPPGVHLAVMIATFWPATAFLGAGLGGLRAAIDRPAVRFALCWAVPSWLVFELTATKLPHYVLPIFPALALLTMALVEEGAVRASHHWLLRGSALLLGAVPVALAVGALAVPALIGDSIPWPAVAVLGAAAAAGVLAARALAAGRIGIALGRAAATAALVSLGAYGLALPQLSAIWVSSRIVAMARTQADCPQPRIVSVGWREPSLVFLGGTDTALKTAAGAVEDISREGCVVLAITGANRAEFAERAGPALADLHLIGTISGFALNGGDPVGLDLYQVISSR